MSAVTEAEAYQALYQMVAADSAPTLSQLDLTDLLARHRRPDSLGRLYGDVDYVATWNLDAAAQAGWLLKTSRAVPDYSFSTDGQTFHRGEVFRHCEAMVERFARRAEWA